MKNTLLLCLLFWTVSLAYSQSESTELGKFYFGIDLNLNETQIKPQLFDNAKGGDAATHYYGISLISYLNLKNNWYLGLGASFNVNNYIKRKRFVKRQIVSSPINAHEEFFENMVGDFTLDYKVRIDESNCYSPRLEEDFDLESSFTVLNKIQYVGIPILIGKTMGKKRIKLYTEFTLRPIIITKKEIKFDGGGLGLSGYFNRNCVGAEAIHYTSMELLERQVTITDYNIKDSRLDAKVEIGMLERFKKIYYKLGVFYGESLSPLTKIQDKNYYGQIAGAKIEFGILAFKKTEIPKH